MRTIAIPLKEGTLFAHFGKAPQFLIAKTEDSTITENKVVDAPPHEHGHVPVWLESLGVTDVIAGGMGHGAIARLKEKNINIFTGAYKKKPEELILDLLNGNLESGVNLCDH